MSETLRWQIPAEQSGERLDCHLAAHLTRSRTLMQRWIAAQRVTVNGRAVKASTVVVAGDTVVCRPPPPAPELTVAEPGPLAVLHADDDLVVINKPPGLAVHPGAGHRSGTLVHFLLHHYPELAGVGGPGRPGIVHRLDLDTSGVLVVARSDRAWRQLSDAFASRAVHKVYLAIAYGAPEPPSGTIDLPIGRHGRDRKRMTVRSGGRPARTRYRCCRSVRGISWLRLEPETGRTHQIRVHLKAIGHPLVGDPVYGEARWRGLDRQQQGPLLRFPRPALHALQLTFAHPATGREVTFKAPVPEDLLQLWQEVTGEPPPLPAGP